MATVGTPVPPPVKNDWLSSALDNPKLSPPSPGGPRKATPMTQVSIASKRIHTEFQTNYQFPLNVLWIFVLGRKSRTATTASNESCCTSNTESTWTRTATRPARWWFATTIDPSVSDFSQFSPWIHNFAYEFQSKFLGHFNLLHYLAFFLFLFQKDSIWFIQLTFLFILFDSSANER